MRRIILSLFVVMFATLQLSSQTETFVKTMNSNGSRMLYKHIESFNKSKNCLVDYSEAEVPQFIEISHRVMDKGMQDSNYLGEVKKVLLNNLSTDSLNLLYNHNVRLFYTIDNEGNIYDISFSKPVSVEKDLSDALLEQIIGLIKTIEFTVDIKQYAPFFGQGNIWKSLTITPDYWRKSNE